MSLVAFPALLLFIVAPSWVMGLFGSQFESGWVVLLILAAGQFVNVVTGSVGYLLMMSGHESLMRNNIIFSALLNLALNILCVPTLGIVGAAVATAISLAVMNIVSLWLVYLKLGILTLPYPKGLSIHGK